MTVALTAQAVTVWMRGEIDICDAPALQEAARTIIALGPTTAPSADAPSTAAKESAPSRAGRPVTVDCHELTFMDSSALTFFVQLLRADAAVTVTGLRPRLQHLFVITGLDRRLHVVDSAPK